MASVTLLPQEIVFLSVTNTHTSKRAKVLSNHLRGCTSVLQYFFNSGWGETSYNLGGGEGGGGGGLLRKALMSTSKNSNNTHVAAIAQ